MPKIEYQYAFDKKYSDIPNELETEITIIPFPPSQDIKGIKTTAIWDTGATHSSLSPKIAKGLGLKPIDYITVRGLHSSEKAEVVIATISLPNGLSLKDRRFSVCEIPGTDVLIGMDIIKMGDFAISNGGRKTLFSFAIPPFDKKISFKEKADAFNARHLGSKL